MSPDAAPEGRLSCCSEICKNAVPVTFADSFQLLHLLQVFDWDLHNHANELMCLLRRIPGFPNAAQLISTSLAHGFSPSTELSQLRHTPRERDIYMRSVQRTVCGIVLGLLASEQSAWPGSTGCTALLLGIESIKGTVLKLSLELQAILNPLLCPGVVPSGVSNYICQCLELRLALSKKILELVDGSCIPLMRTASTMVCEIKSRVGEKRKTLGILVPDPSLNLNITTPERVRTMRRKLADCWQPPLVTQKGWEELIFAIESVDMDEDEGALWAKLRWKVKDKQGNMQLSQHPITHLHVAAPQMLLQYYQKYIVITTNNSASKGARDKKGASVTGALRKS